MRMSLIIKYEGHYTPGAWMQQGAEQLGPGV